MSQSQKVETAMTTETPRTDALEAFYALHEGASWNQAQATLARTLEREVAALTAERDRLRDALQWLVNLSRDIGIPLFVPQNELLTWADAVDTARAALRVQP